jgi:hypothetical protein
MKLIISIISIFITISSFANNLLHDSPICKKAKQRNISKAHGPICLNAKEVIATLPYRERGGLDKVEGFLQIKNVATLSQLIKVSLINNLEQTLFSQAVSARALGVDLNKFIVGLKTGLYSCEKDKLSSRAIQAKMVKKFRAIAKTEATPKGRKEFYKRLRIANMEFVRLSTLLRQAKEFKQKNNDSKLDIDKYIFDVQKRIEMLYHHYPSLAFFDVDGKTGGEFANLIMERTGKKVQVTKFGFEKMSYRTHPEIDKILKLPPNDIPSSFDLIYTEHHSFNRSPYTYHAYSNTYEKIMNDHEEVEDVWLEDVIRKRMADNLQKITENFEKICNNSPCATFNIAPEVTAKLVAQISRDENYFYMAKEICSCELRKTDEMFNNTTQLTAGLATVGLGVGCFFFPPACAIALTVGAISTGMSVQSYIDDSNNEQRKSFVAGFKSHGVTNYADTLELINEYEQARDKRITSQFWLITEGLFVGGDIAQIVRQTSKGVSVLPKLLSNSRSTKFPRGAPEDIKDVKSLTRKYSDHQFLPKGSNDKWLELAEKDNLLLLGNIDSGQLLKTLAELDNPKLAKSLQNLHTDIVLRKIDKFNIENPTYTITPYRDDETLRFAIQGRLLENPNVHSSFLNLLEEANKEFSYLVPKIDGVPLTTPTSPDKWFAVNVGGSTSKVFGGSFDSGKFVGDITSPAIKLAPRDAKTVTSKRELEELYLKSDFVPSHVNQSWIDFAKQNDAKFYFEVENAAMKRINDDLGDKNLVTALTNMHKDIYLKKVKQLQKNNPGMIITPYSDYKSLRFAVSGKIPDGFDVNYELSKIYDEAGSEFKHIVDNMKGIEMPATEHPRGWFMSSYGDASADTIGVASNVARRFNAHEAPPGVSGEKTERPIPKIVNANDPKVIKFQEDMLAHAIKLQKELTNELSEFPNLLSRIPGTKDKTLSLEVFEFLRKLKAEKNLEELRKLLSQKFGADVSEEAARKMQDYANTIDIFSPGLWQKERTFANLDDANFGGLSGDFSGLGAQNLLQLAQDVSRGSGDLQGTIKSVRKGEQAVTESFKARLKEFHDTMGGVLKSRKVEYRLKCSGDDCVIIPARELDEGDKEAIMQALARSDNPAGQRISFVPRGVPSEARTKLAAHGELVEKKVRSYVTGLGEEQVSSAMMKNVSIAIDTPKTLKSGTMKIIVTAKPGSGVTPEMLDLIRAKLKDAVQRVNKDLSEELDEVINYSTSFSPPKLKKNHYIEKMTNSLKEILELFSIDLRVQLT